MESCLCACACPSVTMRACVCERERRERVIYIYILGNFHIRKNRRKLKNKPFNLLKNMMGLYWIVDFNHEKCKYFYPTSNIGPPLSNRLETLF